MLRTLRKNKREIPPSFVSGAKEASSKFAFHNRRTLVSYVPRKNKAVSVLSTMHYSKEIDEASGKPDIILDYNIPKKGTDTFDKMCDSYTASRATRR